MKKKIRLCFLLAAVLMLATSCGNMDEPDEELPAPTNSVVREALEPVSGGNLKLSMRLPKTLNPLLNQDATVDTVLKLIFEPLAVLDEDQKPQPNLADTFDFASDGLSVVVYLRNDVYWSDGRAMTAEDLLFTLSTLDAAAEDVIYKEVVQNISSYTKIDEKTVKINYKKPFSGSSYLLCFPIIPRHYYIGEKAPDSAKNMTPMGNGLYNFVSYNQAKEMTLAASQSCFRQPPFIDNVTTIITPDAQTDLYAFDQGLIDAASAQIAEWGKYRGLRNTRITEYATMYFEFIGFNLDNTFLKNLEIRQAIAHATPVDEILDEIYLSYALKAAVPVSPASWLYNPEAKHYDYDPDQARILLSAAGYAENDGALQRDFDGTSIELALHIIVNEENEERVKIANKLVKNLNELKIKCEVEVLPFEEFEARLREGNFDLFVGGFHLSPIPDLTFAFHSSNANRRIAGANYFGYRSEELDTLLEQASGAFGDLNYKKAMGEVQRQIIADLPCIGLVFRNAALLTDQKVRGESRPVVNNIFANLNEWFIYEES